MQVFLYSHKASFFKMAFTCSNWASNEMVLPMKQAFPRKLVRGILLFNNKNSGGKHCAIKEDFIWITDGSFSASMRIVLRITQRATSCYNWQVTFTYAVGITRYYRKSRFYCLESGLFLRPRWRKRVNILLTSLYCTGMDIGQLSINSI